GGAGGRLREGLGHARSVPPRAGSDRRAKRFPTRNLQTCKLCCDRRRPGTARESSSGGRARSAPRGRPAVRDDTERGHTMRETTTPVAAYLDPALPVPERVADLLGRMTVAEKVGQMLQLDARGDYEGDILRKHVGSILHTSPHRLERAHELVQQTRLRIPLLVGEDCIHGHSFYEGATIFPTQLGMAASWDPGLVEQAARITAVEAAATGVHWTFSPVLCIARDLRWGRVDETFGEDPYLIGELA